MGPPFNPLPAFSQVSAFRSGWSVFTPLRNRTGVQLVYRSAELADGEAASVASKVSGLPLAPDAHIAGNAPGLRQPWVGNCIGVGEAAAVFDPIDNVGLQSLMLSLSHLTSLVPLDSDMAAERKEFNLNVTSGLERLRDYQICHYKLNKRHGEALWDQCRDMAVPEALAYKIKLFEARGHLVEYDDETFVEHDWYALFLGHGLIPRAYDPVVDETADKEVAKQFQNLLDFIKSKVGGMTPMAAHFTHKGG
jgi:tryptophan halogenase